MDIKKLIEAFESRPPELVLRWQDSETTARGWLVLNSLRGGAAGGGTRMHARLTEEEVVSLAKTMELKFSVTGPQIGGAKSGICFEPNDPRRRDVLRRWFKATYPLLKKYYGTGGDMNVEEMGDVVPIIAEYGLKHPQEGIVNGHYQGDKLSRMIRIERLRSGMSAIVKSAHLRPRGTRAYTVSELITGYGVAQSIKHYYALWGGSLAKKRAIIQGWGNVASVTALYLSKWGVRIVGILDRTGGLIVPEGLDAETIEHLVVHSTGNELRTPTMKPYEEINARIWDKGVDIFVPAAASRLVARPHIERMIKAGLEVVSCGANVPFVEEEDIYGATTQFVDEAVSLLPDFVANGGKAAVFAYLMNDSQSLEIAPESIFEHVSKRIYDALKAIYKQNKAPKRITQRALRIALKTLLNQSQTPHQTRPVPSKTPINP